MRVKSEEPQKMLFSTLGRSAPDLTMIFEIWPFSSAGNWGHAIKSNQSLEYLALCTPMQGPDGIDLTFLLFPQIGA
jgi:hypothetical protein